MGWIFCRKKNDGDVLHYPPEGSAGNREHNIQPVGQLGLFRALSPRACDVRSSNKLQQEAPIAQRFCLRLLRRSKCALESNKARSIRSTYGSNVPFDFSTLFALCWAFFCIFPPMYAGFLKCWFRGCRLATGDLHSALIEQCRTVPVQRNHRVALVGDVVVERVLDAGGGLRIDEQTVVLVEMLR